MRASLTIVSILALALPACGGGDGDEGGDPADVATSSDSAEPTIDEGPAVDGAAETKDEGEPVVEGPFPGAPAPEELEIPGLEGPVHIVRDETGMPHVHATTLHDLFFAQGYVHALDRFPE